MLSMSDDKYACIYLFKPNHLEYYIVGKNCQPKSTTISRLPKNGQILLKLTVDVIKLDIIYSHVLKNLSHNKELTVISDDDGKYQGPVAIISKIITDTTNDKTAVSLTTYNCGQLDIKKNITEIKPLSTTPPSPPILTLDSKLCSTEQLDIMARSKYINYGKKHSINFHKFKREQIVDGYSNFNNPQLFLEQIYTQLLLKYCIPEVFINEFILKLMNDSNMWKCGICCMQLVNHDVLTNTIQARHCIRYHVNKSYNNAPVTAYTHRSQHIAGSSTDSNSIHGLLCNICFNDFENVEKQIKSNEAYTLYDFKNLFKSSEINPNTTHPGELLCIYASNYYCNIQCPMDCNEDDPLV